MRLGLKRARDAVVPIFAIAASEAGMPYLLHAIFLGLSLPYVSLVLAKVGVLCISKVIVGSVVGWATSFGWRELLAIFLAGTGLSFVVHFARGADFRDFADMPAVPIFFLVSILLMLFGAVLGIWARGLVGERKGRPRMN